MPDLSDDERMLLAVLAAAEEPMVQSAVTDQILPPFPTGWVRKAGKQAWLARWDAVMAAWAQLERHGLLECLAADSTRYVLTDAGREALANTTEHA